MTRFLPTFLRQLLRQLLNYTHLVLEPRRRLKPKSAVEPSGSDSFDWRANGPDPQLLWRRGLPHAGWYMVEVVLRHDQPLASMRVYFNTGAGFTDEGSFCLPLKAGRLTKRLCLVPPGVTAVRIDPMESAGEFTIEDLRFARVTRRMALDRLVRRLCNMHPFWRDIDPKDVIPKMREHAGQVDGDWLSLARKYYEETFASFSTVWSYPEWIARNPPLRAPVSDQEGAGTQSFDICMVGCDSDPQDLRRAVESVLSQTLECWQLKIAITEDLPEGLDSWLRELCDQDVRVHVSVSPRCESAGAVVHRTLEHCSGQWLLIMGPEDRLSVDALQRISGAAYLDAAAEIIYSDEDRVDCEGHRFDPRFKPAWNPDLFLSQNYVGRAVWFRRQRVETLKADLCESVEAVRYCWLLRLAMTPDAKVARVPYVLYHGGSASPAIELKDEQECRAILADWLREVQLQAEVEKTSVPGGFRVRHQLSGEPPLVSLLIPTRNGIDILQPCVDAILDRTRYSNFEVLILDNQSDCERTLKYLVDIERDPRVRVLRWDHPFNYSGINNFGAIHARGTILGLINNDIEPINDEWLDEMVSHAARPEIGCVGAKLYYPNDTVQHAGVILGIGGVAGHAHKYLNRDDAGYANRLKLVQNFSAVTGACLLLRKSVFEEVGGLEEENLAIAFNDVDLCLRVREAGYRNLWTPYAEAYHHESVSRGADDTPEKRARASREAEYMRRKWRDILDNDPAYNPNLTLVHEDFSLR